MGYFVKKNKNIITGKLLKTDPKQEINIDLEKQENIVEDVLVIPEKRDIKKKVALSDANTKQAIVKPEQNVVKAEKQTLEVKKVEQPIIKKGSVVVHKTIGGVDNLKIFSKTDEVVSGRNLTETYMHFFKKNGKNQLAELNVLTKKINHHLEKRNIVRSFIDLDKLQSFIKNKTIVLVANSSDLLKHKNGSLIDSYDIVVRFNSFKIDSEYTGEKTTIHASVHLQDINLDYFVPIRFIVSNNLNKWSNKILSLNKFDQSLLLKYNHHNEIEGQQKDKNPSTTGFVMLTILLKLGGFKKLDLIGFNFYESGLDSILRTDEGVLLNISNVHDYDYEKKIIMSNAYEYDKKNNIITYYDSSAL